MLNEKNKKLIFFLERGLEELNNKFSKINSKLINFVLKINEEKQNNNDDDDNDNDDDEPYHDWK